MSGADTWMPLYVGDYLADTAHLTQVQHGAYLLLLMGLWRRGGKIPDDDAMLAAITHSTPQEWKRLRPVLQNLCVVERGEWTQKRLTRELENSKVRYASKVANGRKGGRPRHNTGPDAAKMHTENETEGLAMGSARKSDGVLQSQLHPQGSTLGVVGAARPGFDGPGGQR